jgi:hypothetical protein
VNRSMDKATRPLSPTFTRALPIQSNQDGHAEASFSRPLSWPKQIPVAAQDAMLGPGDDKSKLNIRHLTPFRSSSFPMLRHGLRTRQGVRPETAGHVSSQVRPCACRANIPDLDHDPATSGSTRIHWFGRPLEIPQQLRRKRLVNPYV